MNKNKILDILAVLVILMAGAIGGKALLHPGFYTSHDGEHQLVRQYTFDQGLRDQQIPARYSRQLYRGYGYPLFVFTYRLPFYIGEVFRIFGLSYADCVKMTFFTAYVLSGLTMFWFVRRQGLLPALMASLLYLWAPYRFSVMFVRAALGEHLVFVFLPLLFWAISEKKVKLSILVGSVSIGGIILSHAMMAQLMLMPVAIWALVSLLTSKDKFRFITRILGMSFLGVGLVAYYLIPAMTYQSIIQKLLPFFFADHFVTIKQLLYSPWGYGFSMQGVLNDGMSFQIGVAQWLVAGMVSLLTIWHLIKRKLSMRLVSLLVIFGMSVFLMTDKSRFIWEWGQKWMNVDIPWRLLTISTFTAAVLAGWVIHLIKSNVLKVITVICVLGLAVYGNRNYLRVNKYIDYPDQRLVEFRGTSNSYDEYRPRWENLGKIEDRKEEFYIPDNMGEGEVTVSKSNELNLAVNLRDLTQVTFNILDFPGWNVVIDGKNAEYGRNGRGSIKIEVSEGYHFIQAIWRETRIMKIADMISVISWGLVLYWGFVICERKKPKS